MSKNSQQQAQSAKTSAKFFKKKSQSLEFYDASAMFITQFILQYMLQLIMMILGYWIIADSMGSDVKDIDAISEKFTLFTASTGGVLLTVFLNESTMLLSPLAYWKVKSFNVFKDMGLKRKVNAGQIAMTLPIAGALLAGFMPIASLFVYLVEMTGYNYTGANINVESFPQLLLYLLFVAALPAVCEEILHRGIVARAGSRLSYAKGLILSSVIFAFMHGSPIQLVHQFFVGVVCVLVYYMSGSLWISALTHFFNNAITLVCGYIIFKIKGTSDLAIPWWGMILLCIAGLAALTLSLWGMYKLCYAKRKKEDAEYGLDSSVQSDGAIRLGKKKPIKVFNEKMAYLFISPEQAIKEKQLKEEIEKEISEYSEEKKEVFYSMRKEDGVELKKKNSRGIIFALVAVLAIWLFNTVVGYF